MTDAGISAEWAEFLDLVARRPDFAARMLILPGNHDVNIVDRANPARLDLPFSPAKSCARCGRYPRSRPSAAIGCLTRRKASLGSAPRRSSRAAKRSGLRRSGRLEASNRLGGFGTRCSR